MTCVELSAEQNPEPFLNPLPARVVGLTYTPRGYSSGKALTEYSLSKHALKAMSKKNAKL